MSDLLENCRNAIDKIDKQIIDLIANGVNGIHVYSMNKPEVARQIQANLSHIVGNQSHSR